MVDTGPDQAQAPRLARRVMPCCVAFLFAIAVHAMCLRWWSDQSWLGVGYVLLPRWPWAVVAAMLWIWCVGVRASKAMVVMLVATWMTLFPVMGLRVTLSASKANEERIRVLTFNVHRAKLDALAFASYLAEQRPDVIALQDWSGVHMETLFQGDEWHTRRSGEFLVASRYPIASVESVDLALDPSMPLGEQGEAAVFVLESPRGPLAVVNVHFASPHNGVLALFKDGPAKLDANHARRRDEMRLVQSRAAALTAPTIVVGDFNTTDPSPLFRGEWNSWTDSFVQVGSGFGYTYYNRVAQLRLDRILVRDRVVPMRCWVGPFFGSPHRPVLVDLRVESPKAAQ